MAEHGRSGGPKTKDSAITEGFNRNRKGLSKAELARAKREAKARAVLEGEKRKSASEELERLAERAGKLRDQLGIAEGEPVFVEEDEAFESSPEEMIRDLRYAYRKGVGKKKLQEMMKDERHGVALIRELVKVEVAFLQAKLRMREDQRPEAQQAVFVVIKGLADEKKYEAEVTGAAIDMKQISRALNPDGTEHEH